MASIHIETFIRFIFTILSLRIVMGSLGLVYAADTTTEDTGDEGCCYTVKTLSSENGYSMVNISVYDKDETDWIFNVEVDLPQTYNWYGAQPYSAPLGTVTCGENTDTSVKSTIYTDSSKILTCKSTDAFFFTAILHIQDSTNSTTSSAENDMVARWKQTGSVFASCTKKSYCTPVVPGGLNDGKMSFGAFGRHPRWFIIVLVFCFGALAALILFYIWHVISTRHYGKDILGTEKRIAKKLYKRQKAKEASKDAENDSSSTISGISNPTNVSVNGFDRKPTDEYPEMSIIHNAQGNSTFFASQNVNKSASLATAIPLNTGNNNISRDDSFYGVEGRQIDSKAVPTRKKASEPRLKFQNGTLVSQVEARNRDEYLSSPSLGPATGKYGTIDLSEINEQPTSFDEQDTIKSTVRSPRRPSIRNKGTLIDQMLESQQQQQLYQQQQQQQYQQQQPPPSRGTHSRLQSMGEYSPMDDDVPLDHKKVGTSFAPLIAPEQIFTDRNRSAERGPLQVNTNKLIGSAGHQRQYSQSQKSTGNYNNRGQNSAKVDGNKSDRNGFHSRGTGRSAKNSPIGKTDLALSSSVRQSPFLVDDFYGGESGAQTAVSHKYNTRSRRGTRDETDYDESEDNEVLRFSKTSKSGRRK